MRENTQFFEQIEHVKVPWGDRSILFPVFYYDVTTLTAQFIAPLKTIHELLPSPRLHPLLITPWHCVVSISAFEYRDSDIGAYHEVSISIPVVLDKPSPLFIGTLNQVPEVLKVYVHHLPVTTEIACSAGVELAGYPKFVADIAFEREANWVRCEVWEGGKHILTLTGREGKLKSAPRSRMQPITTREGYLLRSEFVVSERNQFSSAGGKDVHFKLGDHKIAQEMKKWNLGKNLGYQYTPQHQAILTPVIESFAH